MRAFCVCLSLLTLAAWAADVPPNPAKPAVGMELGSWFAEDAWSNAGTPETIVAEGQKLLKLAYLGGVKDKVAFKHLTGLGVPPDGKLRVYVYTAEEKPPQVALALITAKAFLWHESQPRDLKPGWNLLEFNAGAEDWKTEASAWKFTAGVKSLGDVRGLDFIIFNGDRSGVLYLQGFTFDPNALSRKAAGFIKDLQSDDPEKRDVAEKGLVAVGRPALEALHQIADDERPEVLLRAASAIRQIEALPDDQPVDQKALDDLEKQKEFQGFDEARKQAEYALRGLDTERQRLLSLAKDAQAQLEQGREALRTLKFTDDDKRKAFEESLNKLEAMLKEIRALNTAGK